MFLSTDNSSRMKRTVKKTSNTIAHNDWYRNHYIRLNLSKISLSFVSSVFLYVFVEIRTVCWVIELDGNRIRPAFTFFATHWRVSLSLSDLQLTTRPRVATRIDSRDAVGTEKQSVLIFIFVLRVLARHAARPLPARAVPFTPERRSENRFVKNSIEGSAVAMLGD